MPIAITSVCLLLTRIQPGLAVSFVFVFCLRYFYNRVFLLETVEGSTRGALAYTGRGFTVMILAVISFFFSPKQRR